MNLATKNQITWCQGCPNFAILESVKQALKTENTKDIAMVTGIGCHGKIFDYLNLSGIYGLHGRVLPTALGIKIGNPQLKAIGFAGDGDTYAEGMSHFIHAFKHNANITLIVHDNQSFSLTTGQSTPTSQKGFVTKVKPCGEQDTPINPIKLALASGGTFIARCNALDVKHTTEIIKKALNHKGFSYIEVMQKCLIFNKEMNNLDKLMYKIPDNKSIEKAMQLADKWDYNAKKGKIPLGIIYQSQKPTFEEKYFNKTS